VYYDIVVIHVLPALHWQESYDGNHLRRTCGVRRCANQQFRSIVKYNQIRSWNVENAANRTGVTEHVPSLFGLVFDMLLSTIRDVFWFIDHH